MFSKQHVKPDETDEQGKLEKRHNGRTKMGLELHVLQPHSKNN